MINDDINRLNIYRRLETSGNLWLFTLFDYFRHFDHLGRSFALFVTRDQFVCTFVGFRHLFDLQLDGKFSLYVRFTIRKLDNFGDN